MGFFDSISDALGDVGHFLGEIPKAFTRPLDKILGTHTTNWVNDFVMPAAMGVGSTMLGLPGGAALGAGLGRALGGFAEEEDPLNILKNSLFAGGLGYGANQLIGWPGAETTSLPFTGGGETTGMPLGVGTGGSATQMPMGVGYGGPATSVSSGWADWLPSLSGIGESESTVGGGGGMTGGIWDFIKGNPMTTMMGANVLGSLGQTGMYEDINKGQQKSWQDYLNLINPPENVKRSKYEQLASNIRTQGDVAEEGLMNKLAERGVRGKGLAAPSGDLAESERKMLADAWNQIYGTWNVPSGPGPVNYSPEFFDLMLGNLGQMASQGIPMALILSKYGVKP